MGWRRTLGYPYVAEDMGDRLGPEDGLGRRMVAGGRTEEALRGEGHSHCDRDHAPWNLACTGVGARLLLGLS